MKHYYMIPDKNENSLSSLAVSFFVEMPDQVRHDGQGWSGMTGRTKVLA